MDLTYFYHGFLYKWEQNKADKTFRDDHITGIAARRYSPVKNRKSKPNMTHLDGSISAYLIPAS